MSIIIPEKIIKETLDIIIKFYYDDLIDHTAGEVPDPSAGDTIFTLTVTQQGTPTVQEEVDITVAITINASELAGRYIIINTINGSHCLWFHISDTNTGTMPIVINAQMHKVNILSTDIEADVAIAISNIINGIPDQVFVATIPVSPTVHYVCQQMTDPENSLLWDMFGGVVFDNMNYFDVMSDILRMKYGSERRKLGIYLGYNQDRKGFPIISILLPNEENNPKFTGKTSARIGVGTQAIDVFSNAFESTYNMLITSDNQNEVIVVYNFLKTILLTGTHQFQLKGLQNPYISGRDITMDTELDPMMLFHRTVGLQIFYENTVKEITGQQTATVSAFYGTMVSPTVPTQPSPNTIGDLQFWVKSTVGITKDGGGRVTQWLDQSPNQNNLTQTLGVSRQPLEVPNTLNGKPSIQFNIGGGTSEYMDFTITPTVTKLSIMLVYEVDATIITSAKMNTIISQDITPQGCLLADRDIGGIGSYTGVRYEGTNPTVALYQTGATAVPTAVPLFRVITIDCGVKAKDYRNSNLADYTKSLVAQFGEFIYDTLGKKDNNYGQYKLYECAIFHKILTTTETQTLLDYANLRYGNVF